MSDPQAILARVRELMSAGDGTTARTELDAALRQHPRDPLLNNAMAVMLLSAGQHEAALPYLERALEARRNDPALLVNMGRALGALNRLDEALPRFERAAELAPGMAEAWEGLTQVLRLKDRYTEAAEKARRGLSVRPGDPTLAGLYIGLLMHLARVADAVAFARGLLARQPHPSVAGAYAAAMTYHAGADPAQVFEAQTAYGRMLAAPPPRQHTNDPDPARLLRVGILSHELRRHAVATFLEPWLESHDRTSIHLTCYATATLEDQVTARLKAAVEDWVMVAHLPDAAIAERIRADRIDVLIETTGITDGQRLGVMAMRPVPVQASMIGYLNTTGVRAIDYRIVDGHTQPPGSERFSVEKLQRLEPTSWCYKASADAPQVVPPPCTADAAAPLTFGSFNSSPKINDRVIALWARVLAAVPGSRLLLKAYDFADAPLREDLAARFTRQGIEPGRVELEGPTQAVGAFLANYGRIDIALDPFPFNGTTTTLDALWMGVPVVTLAGQMTAGRTGVSILSALGMPELIAPSEDEYVRIAISLAADRARLSELRRTMRSRLAASPLCDGPGFARRMDAAVREMWRAWCGRAAGGPA